MNAAARASRVLVVRQHAHRQLLRRSRNWNGSARNHLRTLSSSSSALATSPENLPSKLIDFSISAKIEGEESQVAMVDLRPGEVLRAESGAMLFMTEGIEMNTDMQGASAAFSRMMTGQNVFLTDFTYNGSTTGTVGLGTDFPSKILRLSLQDYDNSTLICQRGAYMASNPTVDIQMEATKSLSAGFFGGQGFILQRLSGQGDVLVKAGGNVVEKDLDDGQTLRVTSGSIVAFTSTVDYDIQMMPGIKNAMFGGEGLFVTTLRGPGKVWLQGMPPDRMISEIARRVPSGGGLGFGVPLGGGGGGAGGEAAGEAGTEDGTEGGPTSAGADEDSDLVAATDEAVNADRQATVASSGMAGDSSDVDSDSPSALFGDAAPPEETVNPSTEPPPFDNEFSKESVFNSDNDTSFTEETTFTDDDNSFSTDDGFNTESDTFDDPTTTDVFESGGATEEASQSGSSILQTLWDFFSDDE